MNMDGRSQDDIAREIWEKYDMQGSVFIAQRMADASEQTSLDQMVVWLGISERFRAICKSRRKRSGGRN